VAQVLQLLGPEVVMKSALFTVRESAGEKHATVSDQPIEPSRVSVLRELLAKGVIEALAQAEKGAKS
jgi:hypothetical protein